MESIFTTSQNAKFQDRYGPVRPIRGNNVSINGIIGFGLVLYDQCFANIIYQEVVDYIKLLLHLIWGSLLKELCICVSQQVKVRISLKNIMRRYGVV